MMIKIRPEQEQALAEYTERRFVDRLVKLVRGTEFDSEEPARNRAHCTELMARAKAYGFQSEYEMAIFVLCGFAHGFDFYARTNLPFAAILAMRQVEARLRAAQMAQVLRGPEPETNLTGPGEDEDTH